LPTPDSLLEIVMDEVQRVIDYIAANRFPFPGQTDWPPGYRTVVNGGHRVVSIPGPNGPHWPDIVVLDQAGTPVRFGEVETVVGPDAVARWQISSWAADRLNETGVKNLFVYVPVGSAPAALELLDRHEISFAGLRDYEINGGEVRVRPIVTRGDLYDHQ
jgi:hypothetical protein